MPSTSCDTDPALQKGPQQFRDLFDALPSAIYTTDAQGKLTYFNPACVALSGRTPQIGSDYWCVTWKLYYPDGRPMPHDACPMAMSLKERRAIRGHEAMAERPDGTRIWFEPYPTPLFDDDGNLVGGVNMLVEITERKRGDEALRASEERYRTLFELGPVAVYSCDVSGVIQNFNRRAVDLWGRAPAQGDTDERFCGSFKMFLPDGTFMPHDRCPMAEVLSGAVSFVHDGEVHIERPDGSRVAVIVTIRPLKNEHGEITGAINCFYDITERKQADDALRQAKEAADDANRAKDKFLAVLSHELRTPLTPVLMTTAALEERDDLPPALRDDLAMIRRNVELQGKLIDDLLDLSRIRSGKLRLSVDVLGINHLVRHACDTCRPNLREHGIHLYCDLDDEAFDVPGDGARLQQVFWNLLNNAAKFTPEGGQVYIRTENAPGDLVRVTVRDTGRGIEAEKLRSIFDAFEQGEAGITRQFGGLGLGLAICHALVEQHRGSIRAESEGPGKGSTFIVELPALPRRIVEETNGASPASGERVKLPPLRLLVVEDHADTVAILARLLSASGHTVRTATTAAAALKLAGEHSFDMIISDLGLPDMTGYELMRQIKLSCGIKGIAMSGFGMEEDIKKGEQAGFADHLVKPVSFAQLEQSIRRVTNGHPRECQKVTTNPI